MPSQKDDTSWAKFESVDMRVGTIVEAEEFVAARRPTFILRIDFGPLGIKKSSAQITERYTLDQLVGRQIIAVVNFPPKQIGPIMSECLVLGAIDTDCPVSLLSPDHPVPNGTPIS